MSVKKGKDDVTLVESRILKMKEWKKNKLGDAREIYHVFLA